MTTALDAYHEQQAASGVVCLAWHPLREARGALRGFMDLQIPRWRLRLMGCAAFFDEDRDEAWIALPAKLRQEGGKTVFQPTVTFDDSATAAAFSRAAIAALDIYSAGWRQ